MLTALLPSADLVGVVRDASYMEGELVGVSRTLVLQCASSSVTLLAAVVLADPASPLVSTREVW